MTPAALADLVRSVAHDVLTGRGLDPAALPGTVTVERPRDPEHGDYATTVALQTATSAGVAPRELAGWLADALAQRCGVRSAVVAGPGFLNLRLAADAQSEIIAQVLTEGKRFGTGQDLAGRLVNLEADPAGPPRPGAARWAAIVHSGQYAHARLASLARNAADLGLRTGGAQLGLLDHEREGELIRTLGEFPRVVASAAERGEAHRVARYLEQLADAYHRFEDSCRVLPLGDEEPGPRHAARLVLCQATRQVLANGLDVLGVSAPERM